MLDTGQFAPDFTLPGDSGTPITLSQQQPKNVVLYFYPKDSTSGCTVESQDFSKNLSAFHAANTRVFGISKDSLLSHEKFRGKFSLTVPLLSDQDSDVCERYGVWAEKNNFGKKYMGIIRTTILISGSGEIVRIWSKVRVPGHVSDVLAAAQNL